MRFLSYDFKMKHTLNHILAMGLGTVLILSAFSVAMPALTPIPVYAPSEDDNNNNNHDINNHDDLDSDELEFLLDILQCFDDNHNSNNDVQHCLEDALDEFENNRNNNNNNGN